MVRSRDILGMTLLLEVVIGLGIFAASLLFVFGFFASSQKATASSKNLAVATDLARECMETQLALGYGGLNTWTDSTKLRIPTIVDGVETTTEYSVMVEVYLDPGTKAPPNNFESKRIVVTVSWPEVTGAARKTQLETLIVP